MNMDYGKRTEKSGLGALALCAGMIITGTSVAGAQEHPQFTADPNGDTIGKGGAANGAAFYRGIFEGVLEEQTRGD